MLFIQFYKTQQQIIAMKQIITNLLLCTYYTCSFPAVQFSKGISSGVSTRGASPSLIAGSSKANQVLTADLVPMSTVRARAQDIGRNEITSLGWLAECHLGQSRLQSKEELSICANMDQGLATKSCSYGTALGPGEVLSTASTLPLNIGRILAKAYGC